MPTYIKLALTVTALATLGSVISTAGPAQNPAAVAAEIDRLVSKKLAEAKIPASPLADDAEFLRRVSLDITGRVPTAERVVAFLADRDPNKRSKLIDELLADPDYAEHFAGMWFHQMVKRDSDNRLLISDSLADWLADRFNKNIGWNKIVSDILTAEGPRDKNPATVFWFAHVGADREPEPNRITATASRLFLGIRLECCECHNHPFSTLKQTDFWGVAAFFANVDSEGTRNMQVKAGTVPSILETKTLPKAKGKKQNDPPAPFGSIVIPDSKGKTVKAKFFLGKEAPIAGKTQLRPTFASWLTSANNPYFARATVNRWWANFFGRGIVSPVDDMQPDSPTTHPEVLNLLVREFTGSGFDLKHLIKCICNSQTYQRTSRPLPGNKSDEQLYSHASVRMMTADMLFDSLKVVLDHSPAGKGPKAKGGSKIGGGGPRAEFRKFFHTEADDDVSAVADYAHGIPQVLRLMNSAEINNTAQVIGKLMKAEARPEKVVEALYLRVLARLPTADESRRATSYVSAAPNPAQGYADLMWALINSSEFVFNH
jgi:hypothetical protein